MGLGICAEVRPVLEAAPCPCEEACQLAPLASERGVHEGLPALLALTWEGLGLGLGLG